MKAEASAICLAAVSWLFLTAPASATQRTVADAGGYEFSVEVLQGRGDVLVIWPTDLDQPRPQFESVLAALNAAGATVWRVDLLDAYFLARTKESVRTLSGDGVSALLTAAHQDSAKTVVVVAHDRLGLAALRGIRKWQQRHRGRSRLVGAMLLYPNLYGPAPAAGRRPQLDPIVEATNVPILVVQPELGTHRWRLAELLSGLWAAGAPAHALIVPGVRDWYFMHDPGSDPAEDRTSRMLPRQILGAARMLASYPVPRGAHRAPLPGGSGAGVRGLAVLDGDLPAPDFKLMDAENRFHSMSDYAGKVALVNFWATWCPPCVEEIPSMNSLASRFDAEQFEIVSINFRETPGVITRFLDKVPVDFPVLLDRDGSVSKHWNVFSFPSSFLVDRQGRLRYSVNSAIDWNEPDTVDVVRRLLGP